jgi:uncharacterized protein YdaU (DUF1376 family)
MFYYSHHIGDFVRDTARLNDAQCMAYLRLIWAYYDTEKPLDSTPEKLAFQVGAKVEDIQQILDHFFVLQDGVYVHTRCEKEITHFHKKSQSASASANARWKNAKGMRTHSERTANEPKSDANQEPRTKNQQIKKATVVATPDGVSDSVWQEFIAHRKTKKAKVTDLVIEGIYKEAEKAGWTLEDALKETIVRNWQSFKADWVQPRQTYAPFNRFDVAHVTTPPPPNQDAALRKIEEDRKNATPPSLEVLARMAALRQEIKNG